jgi:hypothetical protein
MSDSVEKFYDFMDETVPNHYQPVKNESINNIDTIDVIDFCKMYNLNFNRGNIVKYVCRAGKKDDEIQDLKKALDYLKRELKHLENGK